VINLGGRSVNCRYTEANRIAVKESRTKTTALLGRAIRQSAHPPRLWMNASTATIYRHIYDRPMDEETGEIGGNEPDAPDTRKIALRSAMVMSPDRGGVFDALLRLVRFGLGGTAASGRQFISWIHDADFLSAIEFLIARDRLEGCVNLSSPNPVSNREFMRTLRGVWGTRIGLPAAKWMLEVGAIFLRTETELVLKSRRVIPGRLINAGFQFRFPDWPAAAQDLVARWRARDST